MKGGNKKMNEEEEEAEIQYENEALEAFERQGWENMECVKIQKEIYD